MEFPSVKFCRKRAPYLDWSGLRLGVLVEDKSAFSDVTSPAKWQSSRLGSVSLWKVNRPSVLRWQEVQRQRQSSRPCTATCAVGASVRLRGRVTNRLMHTMPASLQRSVGGRAQDLQCSNMIYGDAGEKVETREECIAGSQVWPGFNPSNIVNPNRSGSCTIPSQKRAPCTRTIQAGHHLSSRAASACWTSIQNRPTVLRHNAQLQLVRT